MLRPIIAMCLLVLSVCFVKTISAQDRPVSGKVSERLLVKIAPSTMAVRCCRDVHYVTSLVISPNGQRVAYIAKSDKKRIAVVVDGKTEGSYDDVGETYQVDDLIVFSPDSKRVAYRARLGKQWLMVIDGLPGKLHDKVGVPLFSPNSQYLGYSYSDSDKRYVLVNGQEFGGDFVVFSQQGNAFAIKGDVAREFLIIDGENRRTEVVDFFSLLLTPNSPRVKLKSTTNGMAVVIDGKEDQSFPLIIPFLLVDERGHTISLPSNIPLIFSPDDKRYAYAAMVDVHKKKEVVVLDGQVGTPYDAIYKMNFSPDSRRFAYVANKNKSDYGAVVAVVDGREEAPVWNVGKLQFSPDSKRLAYWAAVDSHKSAVIVDGKQGPAYEVVYEPIFTQDSKTVAYLAMRNKKLFIIVNGYESTQDGSVYPTQNGEFLSSDAPNALRYVVSKSIDDKTLGIYLIEETLS